MTISSISGAQSTAALQRADGAQRSDSMRKAFQAAATALGMSTDDLRGALDGGDTLSSLAKTKGVSESTLTDAISSAVGTTNGAEVAQRLLAGPGGHGGPGGPGGHGGPPPPPRDSRVDSALSAVADSLGLSDEDLEDELTSGTSLTDVAAAKGVDATTLKATLTDAISAADSTLSADAVSELADRIIEGPPKPEQDNTTDRQAFDLSRNSYDSSAVSQQLLASLYKQQSETVSTSTLSWA
ncbi:uncharacterized protein YidB (DUF937 family) [Actinokineospora baliensis]|uniref:hypothetical protein n=1 Tax=Actinokineospora baliensis TaxID=547056 RepID=UPI00195D4467|nr:hypothetical protein [Actinokineospora baliensis]MBM7773843.1 uncharacterized protein YidB (DUF937 family) [Actinokineospora baliensis]